MPEGVAKDPKPQPKSPAKAQAHMLRTSRRSSDSDEKLLYEKAFMVRPREYVEEPHEPKEDRKDLDQEVDSPFDMSWIKTPGVDDEPGRERANFVRARQEPEKKADKSGLTKLEQIMHCGKLCHI